jgi:5-methylcytosine-specific restriction endonuclease McrA
MTEAVRRLVRQRAKHRCAYCQLYQDDSPLAALHIEHIRPIKHGGTDVLENLCLACIDCNLHKGTNLTGIDPETDKITPLFHPRKDNWDEHFGWNGIRIAGRTAVGRVTVRVLDLNGDDRLDLRVA